MDPTKKPTTKGLGKRIGSSGTQIFNGIISAEEYNVHLVGMSGKRIYDIMRRSDSSVHATLQVCKLPIMSAVWDMEPASDDERDQEIAEFVKRELFDRKVNWHDFLREGLTMFDFGFSCFEKTYEVTDFKGSIRIGLQELGSRKQRSIQYWSMQNGQPGIRQQIIGDGNGIKSGEFEIPMEKLIVFTNEKEGDNYEGISVLRFAYKDWDIKDKLTLVHAIALEKMAMGVPVLTPPANVNPKEAEAARESMREMRANEESFIEKPAGWELDMLDMKGQETKDILPTLQYLDKNITKSVLAQFLELGSAAGGGSRALSQDHSALFMLSEEAAAKNLQATIQSQLIKQLVDLNYSDLPNGYPKLTFSKIGDDDITVVAEAVSKLLTSGGITADPELEGHLRQTMHLPAVREEIKDAYDKEVKKDPTQFLKKPGAMPLALAPGEPADPEKKASEKEPKPVDKSIQKDPTKETKEVKASAIHDMEAYRSSLIAAVQAEYASAPPR